MSRPANESLSPPIRQLISQAEIAAAVRTLGQQISQRYQGQPLVIVGVLTGSIVFIADLMRQITVPHQLALVWASSYRGTATSPGQLELSLGGLPELAGKCVLLVDDIFDTGRTLTAVADHLRTLGPASLQTAVLLWKRCRTLGNSQPDDFCFEIGDEFVVGYGLDFNDQYRWLPYLGVIET